MTRKTLLPVAGIALAWLVLASLVSSMPFTIDEAIYVLGAEAMTDRLSVTVQNGYERFGSDTLDLRFLVPGPAGLTPQYPSGFFVLTAPLFALLDGGGMIVVNTLSAVATLFLCHALARRLFGDARLALHAVLILALATFLPE